jgi:hypothetical protein
MTAPNPEFAARLLGARVLSDELKDLELDIPVVGDRVRTDTIEYQGRQRYKNHETVAAMLGCSQLLRAKLSSAELAAFDNAVAKAREIWLAAQTQKPNGQKIINAIVRVSPL